MSKRIFILIVVLMSVSLIGIIAVQIYWIKNAIENKQRQFKTDVTIAMAGTSEKIREKEENEAYIRYSKFIENNVFRTKAEIKNFLFQDIDTTSKRKFLFGARVLDEEYKIPTGFSSPDSTFVRKITKKSDFMSIKITSGGNNDFNQTTEDQRFSVYIRDTDSDKKQFAEVLADRNQSMPIHKRITNRYLNNLLSEQFSKRGINQPFKYGVYEDGLATKLKSGYFQKNETNYTYPLLEDRTGNSKYYLYVDFPEERKSMISGMLKVLLLSLLFIGIIIAAFSTSLYQLVRQKRISKIKTDFINNMTHEFKTPIATINLALDAIKNPKIINDEEKVKRYIQMIRDENKRMHGQVESVLRISKLEKNQIDISKETVDMTDILEEAIEHVSLLIEDRKGHIKTHFKAIATEVFGNQFHLINVVVNMLENAIKYSEDAPKIDVFTENTNKFFIFKVKDKGIGMSKQAQKQVFEKFYREHGGNIHNVKGHGLGLAYVKEILDNHQGIVYVESEKGKGSTFTVKLPLI